MASSKTKSISAVWWNVGGWYELVSTFRLSCSISRIIIAFASVVLTWIIAALWDTVWVWCGGQHIAVRFASASIVDWPSIMLGSISYSIILALLIVWIWALAGGAICRGQVLNYGPLLNSGGGQTLRYSKDHLQSLLWTIVLLPLALSPFALFCFLNGLIIRVPWVGDVLGGLMLGLSFACGLLIVYLAGLWVLTIGFYWPATASDGFGAAECVVRCATYVQSRLFRAIWLIAVGLGLAVGAWWVADFLYGLGESSTRGLMRLAATLWAGEGPNRIDLLWPIDESGNWRFNSDGQLAVRYRFSHALLGGWLLIFRALLWAWVINVLLGVFTIAYLALRSEVDGVDRREVFGIGRRADSSSAS